MTATMTAPSLQELANFALQILARDGVPADSAANTDEPGWHVGATGENGTPLDISLAGPDIPSRLDEEIIPPPQVAEQLGWKGQYRLLVLAPRFSGRASGEAPIRTVLRSRCRKKYYISIYWGIWPDFRVSGIFTHYAGVPVALFATY